MCFRHSRSSFSKPASSGTVGQDLVDGRLDLLPPEAQVGQGRDEVLLLRRALGRQDLFLLLELVLELHGDAQGRLLADPRDERDPGDVGAPDGVLEVGGSMPERMFMASLGPIPEMPMSLRNMSFSSRDAKP